MTATDRPPTVLLGNWSYVRHIHDRHNQDEYAGDGTVSITQQAPDLITWEETGRLFIHSRAVAVSRTYLLTRRPDGWMVRFADGHDFHQWEPAIESVHPCRTDAYHGSYDLAGLPTQWSTRWTCTGPHKDHTIDTTIRRPMVLRRTRGHRSTFTGIAGASRAG